MDLSSRDYALRKLGSETVNVVLGKNGVGKSELLRKLDKELSGNSAWLVKYVSPERGGELAFNASTEQNMRNPRWELDARRRNRVDQFRNMSFAAYRNLELLVLRKFEIDRDAPTFELTMEQINSLLDNVELVRGSKADPELRQKKGGKPQAANTLSSGESELLSLAIEILSYVHQAEHKENADKHKLLLLDEPDVHLHPDLQYRLMELISTATKGTKITTIVATHSTALLGALAGTDACVAFMGRNTESSLDFKPITKQLEDIIPIFGAHPLTNVFAESPILLVEGEDDVRIWQQAVRSSQGQIKLWPCAAGDIQSLTQYESLAESIIGAVYDGAKAYSLRDRDDAPYEIVDRDHIIRMRLCCRTAENLILSDDVLELLGSDWLKFQDATKRWLNQNPDHPQNNALKNFSQKFDRVDGDVKALRNLFMTIIGSDKPWEVAIGQAIGRLDQNHKKAEGSLAFMLGQKAITHLVTP